MPRIWLPLIGNLKNQGLSDAIITNHGATVDSDGKIGQCYSFDGIDNYIEINSGSLNSIICGGNQEFTISMWVCHSESTAGVVFGDYGLDGCINFNLELTATHQIRFYWDGTPDAMFQQPLFMNKWVYITLVYTGTEIQEYLDGVLMETYPVVLTSKTKTSGSYYLGKDTRTGDVVFKGKINDFRVYDYALSAKEIENLSRGLLLHYTLDRDGFGYNNYMTRHIGTDNTQVNIYDYVDEDGIILTNELGEELSGGELVNYYLYSTDDGIILTNELGEELTSENYDAEITHNYDITISSDSFSKQFRFYIFLSDKLVLNQKYTVSCYVSGLDDGNYYNLDLMVQENQSLGTLCIDHNGLCSMTFTMTYEVQNPIVVEGEPTYMFYFLSGSRSIASGQEDIILNRFMLNQGELPTRWMYSFSDPIFSGMELGDKIIYDTSGYLRNSVMNGEQIFSKKAIRYAMSMEFNGIDNYIEIPLTFAYSIREYTISVWFYKRDIGQKNWQTVLSFPGGYKIDTRHNDSSDLILGIRGWNDQDNDMVSYELNKWNLITFVHTTSGCHLYLNGIEVVSGNSAVLYSGKYILGASDNNTENFKGILSDFRIYGTALSQDDINELYYSSASLSDNGTLFGYEFVEGDE